jgi:uncharacterized protein (DUF305 family)
MEKTPLLYGIIGLLAGIVLSSIFVSYMPHGYRMMGGNTCGDGMMCTMSHDKMMSGMNGTTMDMSTMMDSMNAGLMGKTGEEFEKAFLSEMILHHQGAVAMAEQVLARSHRAELITFAQNIISAQTKEIDSMKGWQTAWFK